MITRLAPLVQVDEERWSDVSFVGEDAPYFTWKTIVAVLERWLTLVLARLTHPVRAANVPALAYRPDPPGWSTP